MKSSLAHIIYASGACLARFIADCSVSQPERLKATGIENRSQISHLLIVDSPVKNREGISEMAEWFFSCETDIIIIIITIMNEYD